MEQLIGSGTGLLIGLLIVIVIGGIVGWLAGLIVKGSGYGRFGGKAGVEAFTELRWITLQTSPAHYPF